MNDFIERLTSYKTTVIGVATAIMAILSFFGVLKPEHDGVEVVTTLWEGILEVLGAIAGITLILSKDSSN